MDSAAKGWTSCRSILLCAILLLIIVAYVAVLSCQFRVPEKKADPLSVTGATVDLDARPPTVFVTGDHFASTPDVLMGPVDGQLDKLAVISSTATSIRAVLPNSTAQPGNYQLVVVNPPDPEDRKAEDEDLRAYGDRVSVTNLTVGSLETLDRQLKDRPSALLGLASGGQVVTSSLDSEIKNGEGGKTLDPSILEKVDRPLTIEEFRRLVFVNAPENFVSTALLYGPKWLTTPWPTVNGSRGPVTMQIPKATGNLAWNVQEITKASQVEYEVTYGVNFTKLDGDEPGRIASGTIDNVAATVTLDFASYGKGPGTYYVRVAAQDSGGKDVAYRAQPVKVRVHPKGGPPGIVVKVLNFVTVNFFSTTIQFFPTTLVSDPLSFPEGPKYFQWRTSLKNCQKVRFEVVEDDFKAGKQPIFSQIDSGSIYKLPNGDPYPWFHRWGHIDLKPVYQKLLAAKNQPGKAYALRVVPLDSQSKSCGAASDQLYLQYFEPYGKYIKHFMLYGQYFVGAPKGSLKPPPIHEGYHKVTPEFNCWKDNTKFFIVFEQEMDKPSVEKALTISPPWPDKVIKWYDKTSKITGGAAHSIGVGHMSNLWFDTVYTITLGTGAKTQKGKKILQTPVQWRFKTLPYAEKIPSIQKMNYTKAVTIPPGDMTISYKFTDVAKGEIRLWNVYATGPALQLPEATQKYKITSVKSKPTYEPTKETCIHVTLGNALMVSSMRFPFKVSAIQPSKTDLAIALAYLVPGKGRDPVLSLEPFVKVINKGPDPVPKEILPLVKVETTYFVSPPFCSDTWCKSSARKVVAVNTLQHCKAPFKKGDTCIVVPTSKELPKGKFQQPTRLYAAQARLKIPYNTHYYSSQFLNDNQKNNDYFFDPPKPVNLGDNPLPYEVIAYEKANFKGERKVWELYQGFLQHQVVSLGKLNNSISSIRVGSKVHAAAFEGAGYEGKYWKIDGHVKQLSSNLDNSISSLIVYDKNESEPWGVHLIGYKSGGHAKFFPLSKPGSQGWGAVLDKMGNRVPAPPYNIVCYFDYPSVGVVNDDVGTVKIHKKFSVFLYEAANLKGNAIHIKGPITQKLNQNWKNKVSSIRMPLTKN